MTTNKGFRAWDEEYDKEHFTPEEIAKSNLKAASIAAMIEMRKEKNISQLTKEERKNRDKEVAKIVKAKDLWKPEYIGDYKGSSVHVGFPRRGKDSPVLILWNREETQVVSGKQSVEILNTILDLNNREYERIDGVYPGHGVCFEMKNGLSYLVNFEKNCIIVAFCTEFHYKWDPYVEMPDRMPEHEIEKAKEILKTATNMCGLEKNDKRALRQKVDLLIELNHYEEWKKKKLKKYKPEPIHTDEEACKIIKSMMGTHYDVDEIYDAGEAYMFTRKNKFGEPVYHTGLCALNKKSQKCDYVWTPPGSDGWKLMQNARRIDLS